MTNKQIELKIEMLLDLAQIPADKKKVVLSKLPDLNSQQIEKLNRNLIRQIALKIRLSVLEEIKAGHKIITKEVNQNIKDEIVRQLSAIKNKISTKIEIDNLRNNLASL